MNWQELIVAILLAGAAWVMLKKSYRIFDKTTKKHSDCGCSQKNLEKKEPPKF